jgi:hypothetical protein
MLKYDYYFTGHALQCYVGIGNASDPLHNDNDLSLGSGPHPNPDEGFFMRECGERGSQVRRKLHLKKLFNIRVSE